MSFSSSSLIAEPAQNNHSIRLDLCAWPEIEEYLTKCRGIILPIGSTEQHGPTGAIGTDAMTAEAVALEVGRLTGVLVAPTQAYGMAEHHLDFPGTMSLKPSTLASLMHDLLLSLARHGFERVFIINGHGGNIATLKSSFPQVYQTIQGLNLSVSNSFRCKVASWFMVQSVYQEAKELYGDKEGQHATPSEIALTLHLHPSLQTKQRKLPQSPSVGPIYDCVDFRKRYPDGRMGSDPFLAKPNHGQKFLEKAAIALSNDLSEFLKEQ